MNDEVRLSCCVECNLHHAACSILNARHVSGRETQFGHLVQNALSSLVTAYTAHKKYGVTEPAQMRCKIERGSAQMFLSFNNIPKDFTDADNFHSGLFSGVHASLLMSYIFTSV